MSIKEDVIIGGTCFRLFEEKSFAELVFMCVGHDIKGKGVGSQIIDKLKGSSLCIKNIYRKNKSICYLLMLIILRLVFSRSRLLMKLLNLLINNGQGILNPIKEEH